jgi:ABC-type transport system substrate-binding protein
VSHKIQRRIPWSGVAGVLAASALVLSGCAAGTTEGPGESGGAPETFVVGVDASIHTLDPNQAVNQAQLQILNLIGGTLTVFAEGDLADVVPGLAESWEVSEDGLLYTFTLVEGATFSDGSALTSADVAASLTRVITDEASANAGMVANWVGAEAVDESTVTLALSAPQPSVLSLLADPELGIIMPAGELDSEEFYLKPISAGAYMIESFEATNGDAVLVRNPEWTGAVPAIPTIEFTYIKDSNTRIVQLKGGSIDLALNIPPNTLSQLTGDVEGTITPAFGGNFLVVNNKDSILGDVRVRQAISLAMDRERISEVVWASGAAPMYQFWPNASVLSDPVLPEGVDVEAAKKLLVGTECESGCSIAFNMMGGMQSTEDMAALIAEDLSAIGITVDIQLTDGAAMGEMMGDFTFQLLSSGLYDYGDRADILLAQGIQSDGGTNALFSGYASDEMDELIAQAISATGDERAQLLSEINELFGKDLPNIPIVDWVFVNGQAVDTLDYVTFEPSGWLRVATEG